ncbi:hypothetical protein [Bowmanella dokdonensis]
MYYPSEGHNVSRHRTRKILSALLLTTLISCGGGGGDEGTPPPTDTDTTSPVVTIATTAGSYWAQDTVSLSVAASDNSGQVNVALSCTDGTLSDTELTLPDTDTQITVTCTATATDAAGNSRAQSVNITVNPVSVSLLTAGNLTPGQIAVLQYSGPALDPSSLSFITGDSNVMATVVDNNIFFIVPVVAEGQQEFQVSVNNRQLSFTSDLLPGAPISDVRNYLDSEIDSLVAFWQANLPDLAPGALQQLISDKQSILDLPADQLALLANMLYFNQSEEAAGADLLGRTPANKASSVMQLAMAGMGASDTQCNAALVLLSDAGPRLATIMGAYIIAAGVFPVNVPVILLGTAVTIAAIGNLDEARNETLENCVVRVASKIIGIDVSDAKGQDAGIASVDEVNLTFSSGKTRVFSVESDYNVEDESAVDAHNSLFGGLAALVNSTIELVRETAQSILDRVLIDAEKTEMEEASTLFISNFVGTNISHQISTRSATEFNLTFQFVDETKIPAEGYQDFSFRVKNADGSVDIPVLGKLYDDNVPDLVFIWDGQELGNDTPSLEAIMEIKPGQQETNGTFLVLNKGERAIKVDKAVNANNEFVLSNANSPVLDTGQSASYSLTYKLQAKNESTASLIFGQQGLADFDRSFTVKSVLNYAGAYQVETVESSSEEGCARDPYTLTYSLTKVNYKEYSLMLGDHKATFTAGGSSISTSGTRTFEEDEGITTESYSISVNYHGEVTGGSSWNWTSEDGVNKCAGSSSFSGVIL